jgi:hypothetical protein
MLLLTGKVVFVFILTGLFLAYFGFPLFEKYLKHDTVFTETRVKFAPEKTVGITIFAWHKNYFNGWKNSDDLIEGLKKMCNESIDFERVVQCINEGTFKHNDIIDKYTTFTNDGETDVTMDTRPSQG